MLNEKNAPIIADEQDDTVMEWNNTCSDCKWYESRGYCKKFDREVDGDDDLCSYGITAL